MAYISIKEIAELSGVGIATVSRVINQSGSVSEKTRKKVMQVVDEYGYVPNKNARNLKKTKSEDIALFVKGVSNPIFSKMIAAIQEEMDSRGYPLFVQNVVEEINELDLAISETLHKNFRGVIILGSSSSNTYTDKKMSQIGVPCVLLTVDAPSVQESLYSSVTIDDEKEGYKATKYLIEMGHRHIGFLYRETDTDTNTPNILRYKGYLRALEESGIPVEERLIATRYPQNDEGYRIGFQCMKQLMQKNPDMTAVFAFADVLAVGAAKAVFAAGKKVPDDISVLGFDGIEVSEFYHPSIDTVYQPVTEMALSAVSFMHSMINGDKGRHMVYDSTIIRRGSVCRKE